MENDNNNDNNDLIHLIQNEDAAFQVSWRDWFNLGLLAGNHVTVSLEQWESWLDEAKQELFEYLLKPTADEEEEEGDEQSGKVVLSAIHLVALADDYEDLLSVAAEHPRARDEFVSVDCYLEGLEETMDAMESVGLQRINRNNFTHGFAALASSIEENVQRAWRFVCSESSHLQYLAQLLDDSKLSRLKIVFQDGFGRIEQQHVTALQRSLAEHCSLTDLTIVGIPRRTMQTLLATTRSMRNLSYLNLDQTALPWEISSIADLQEIELVMKMDSLKDLTLRGLVFSSSEVVNRFCLALSVSGLGSITASNWSFPSGSEEAVANAFASCQRLHSEYFSLTFLNALGIALAESDTVAIVDLSLRAYGDPDILASFFSHPLASHWKAISVAVSLTSWSDTFDNALSAFLKQNNAIEILFIGFEPASDAPANIQSKAILDAVDRKSCSLRIIYPSQNSSSSFLFDPTWLKQLNHILSLNEYRRRMNEKFRSISSPEDLSEMLLALNERAESVLFDFLRRNEWNLQKLIVQFAHRKVGVKRKLDHV